jgi:hypothetical protein
MSIPINIVGDEVKGMSFIPQGTPPNLAHIWVNTLLQILLNPEDYKVFVRIT